MVNSRVVGEVKGRGIVREGGVGAESIGVVLRSVLDHPRMTRVNDSSEINFY